MRRFTSAKVTLSEVDDANGNLDLKVDRNYSSSRAMVRLMDLRLGHNPSFLSK